MRRREIVAAIGAVAAWPLGAPAQQRRVYRLGLLSAGQILTSDVPGRRSRRDYTSSATSREKTSS